LSLTLPSRLLVLLLLLVLLVVPRLRCFIR
jgi:hypothetical protein